ncbi:MAG: FecR domain-containing protein [Rhizobiales bacterium]|nr:FecR domain-containing protein [Hyphomicrobiales bacterium]
MSARFWRLSLLAAAAIGMAVTQPALAAKVGVASAVQNEVTDGASGQRMSAGSQLFEQQVVKTGAASSAQLLFLDQTSLSLGPKAQVKLDKFVYDPSRKTGDVVLAATKGAFRFVSGTQDPRSYQIKTPVATIAVRGTIVDGYPANGGMLFIVQEGKAKIGGHWLKAGQAIFFSAKGAATGPFTPDGRFYAVAGSMPFPLYGQDIGEIIEHINQPDSNTDILDQIRPSRNCPGYYDGESQVCYFD